MWIHHSSSIGCIGVLDFVATGIHHLLAHSWATWPHYLPQIHIELGLPRHCSLRHSWRAEILSLCVGGGWPHEIVVSRLLAQGLARLTLAICASLTHSLLHFFRVILILDIVAQWRVPLLVLSHAISAITDRPSLLNIGHAFDHLQLAFVVGVLHFLSGYTWSIEIVLMSWHRLWLLLRVHKLHVQVFLATSSLQLLILFILGMCSFPWHSEVDMLVSGTLVEAHGCRQVQLSRTTSWLINLRCIAHEIVLLLSELGLFCIVVHHWWIIELSLLMLIGWGSTHRQMFWHLTQLCLISRQPLLLMQDSLYKHKWSMISNEYTKYLRLLVVEFGCWGRLAPFVKLDRRAPGCCWVKPWLWVFWWPPIVEAPWCGTPLPSLCDLLSIMMFPCLLEPTFMPPWLLRMFWSKEYPRALWPPVVYAPEWPLSRCWKLFMLEPALPDLDLGWCYLWRGLLAADVDVWNPAKFPWFWLEVLFGVLYC